jgi:PhzF family phenazine biosynthesis protein
VRVAVSQIVTFASAPFQGNPAYVLAPDGSLDDALLSNACSLLGTDILAVISQARDGETSLRFFSPAGPRSGAGHATHAAARVALERRALNDGTLAFRLDDGAQRNVRRDARGIAVDWPIMPYHDTDRGGDIAEALGVEPLHCFVSAFGYVAVLNSVEEVAALSPDLGRVATFDRAALIVTATGEASDIVIRVFAPQVGLPEDPVCGTAHRIIVPYWAERLGKTLIHSRHLSPRGGDLWCSVAGDTVTIAGASVRTLEGYLTLPD